MNLREVSSPCTVSLPTLSTGECVHWVKMSFLIETGVVSSSLSRPRRNSSQFLAPAGAQFVDIFQANGASQRRRSLCTPTANPNANSAVRSPFDARASQQEANGAAASEGDGRALAFSSSTSAASQNAGRQVMEDGAVIVRDDMDKLLQVGSPS